jgi:hypothetical protein
MEHLTWNARVHHRVVFCVNTPFSVEGVEEKIRVSGIPQLCHSPFKTQLTKETESVQIRLGVLFCRFSAAGFPDSGVDQIMADRSLGGGAEEEPLLRDGGMGKRVGKK